VLDLISKGINPHIMEKLRFDKEVQLTMKMLETETGMFYVQFVETLKEEKIKELLSHCEALWINYYFDNRPEDLLREKNHVKEHSDQ